MKTFNSNKAPEAIGPYSQAIQTGDLVYLSGQLGVDRETGKLLDGVVNQAKQAFKNIAYVLAEADLRLADIVKVTVFLADINDFAAVNEVYAAQFSAPYPSRSAIAVKDLPMGGQVEIEVIASSAE